MIIQALHPAPVSYVPPRSRKERFGLVACQSPVELREDDLSRSIEVGPLFPGKDGVEAEHMRLLDGRLWCQVTASEGPGRFRESGLSEFVDWVSGAGAPDLVSGYHRQFAATPLVAIGSDDRGTALVMSRGMQTRGEEIDLSIARNVRIDGRERSRSEVARYLDEEIRLLDGLPYMRCSPLLHVNGVTGNMMFRVGSRIWPDHPGMRSMPATPATMDEVMAIQRGLGVIALRADRNAERLGWAKMIPEGTLDGDDTRHVVNAFAEPIRRALDHAIEAAGHLRSPERLVAARRAMRAIEIAAMTGTAHHEGDEAILAMREGIAAWMSRPRNGSHGEECLAAFLDGIVIPRMDIMPPEDEEVLGTLSL